MKLAVIVFITFEVYLAGGEFAVLNGLLILAAVLMTPLRDILAAIMD